MACPRFVWQTNIIIVIKSLLFNCNLLKNAKEAIAIYWKIQWRIYTFAFDSLVFTCSQYSHITRSLGRFHIKKILQHWIISEQKNLWNTLTWPHYFFNFYTYNLQTTIFSLDERKVSTWSEFTWDAWVTAQTCSVVHPLAFGWMFKFKRSFIFFT